jgi:hypothetical protein
MFPLTRSLLAAAGAVLALTAASLPARADELAQTSDQSGLASPSSPGLAVNAS